MSGVQRNIFFFACSRVFQAINMVLSAIHTQCLLPLTHLSHLCNCRLERVCFGFVRKHFPLCKSSIPLRAAPHLVCKRPPDRPPVSVDVPKEVLLRSPDSAFTSDVKWEFGTDFPSAATGYLLGAHNAGCCAEGIGIDVGGKCIQDA